MSKILTKKLEKIISTPKVKAVVPGITNLRLSGYERLPKF